MKLRFHPVSIFCFFVFMSLIPAGVFAEGIAEEAVRGSQKADMSYAFGMAIADDLKQTGLEFNYNAFMRGFREVMENQETRLTMEEAFDIVDDTLYAAMAVQAEINSNAEKNFLEQNGSRPGVFTTASGLQYEIIVEGTGDQPSVNDTVKVHYTGYLTDGTLFDTSHDWDEPAEFPLQAVITGWREGLQLMREGGTTRLFIPSALAYGSQGAGGGFIPPYSVLIFEVELFEIMRD